MSYLLDTQAILDFSRGSHGMSHTARELIESPSSVLYLSVASTWELAIKISLGKLILHRPFVDWLNEEVTAGGITLLPITTDDCIVVAQLPFHHRDPFDRMLVAQALGRNLAVISGDSTLDRYGVARVW